VQIAEQEILILRVVASLVVHCCAIKNVENSVKPNFVPFSQARWSKIAYFLYVSEIIATAKVWTVMSNVVQI